LNIDGYSLYCVLFSLLLQGIAQANHATSFNVVLHHFTVKFKPAQQALLVVDDIHSRVTMDLKRYFLSSLYRYDIDNSLFIYLLLTSVFFTVHFLLVPLILIRLLIN
jgi:hypothetical protein